MSSTKFSWQHWRQVSWKGPSILGTHLALTLDMSSFSWIMVQTAPAEIPVSSTNLDTFIRLSAKIKLSNFFRRRIYRMPSVRAIFSWLSSSLKLFTLKFHFVVRRGRLPINCHHAFKYLLWLLTFFSKKFYNWSLLQIEQFLRNLTHRFTWHAVTLTVRIALSWSCICDTSRHVPTCTDLFQSAHCLLSCLGR